MTYYWECRHKVESRSLQSWSPILLLKLEQTECLHVTFIQASQWATSIYPLTMSMARYVELTIFGKKFTWFFFSLCILGPKWIFDTLLLLESWSAISYGCLSVLLVRPLQPVILDYLASKMISSDDLVVVSPDVGGVARARAFAKKLSDAPLAIVDKRRQGHNVSEVPSKSWSHPICILSMWVYRPGFHLSWQLL